MKDNLFFCDLKASETEKEASVPTNEFKKFQKKPCQFY